MLAIAQILIPSSIILGIDLNLLNVGSKKAYERISQTMAKPSLEIGQCVSTEYGLGLVTGIKFVKCNSIKYLIQFIKYKDSEIDEEFGFWLDESELIDQALEDDKTN